MSGHTKGPWQIGWNENQTESVMAGKQVIAFPVDLAFDGVATKSVDAFLSVRGVAELGCNTPLFARLRCRHLKNRIVLFDGIYAAGGRRDGTEVGLRLVHLPGACKIRRPHAGSYRRKEKKRQHRPDPSMKQTRHFHPFRDNRNNSAAVV